MKAIRTILACLRKADQQYNLIQHGDKIVVGLSGGKDSVALTYALHLYQKFSHTDFIIQPVMLDLGFEGFSAYEMNKFCESLGLKLIVGNSQDVYKILQIQQGNLPHLPCSICSKMKKAAINKIANTIGFNKVAFAHHLDDAIETLFMNEIYGGRLATFAPKMHLERADITFIRPFAHVREKDISKLIKEENLPVSPSCCPSDKFTKREEIKDLLSEIYKKFPSSKENFEVLLTNYERDDLWGKEIYYQISQDGLALKPATSFKDTVDMQQIRTTVFIKEQGFYIEDEFEYEIELEAKHYLITLLEKPIGTIRYRKTDEGYKIERFCIVKEYRGKGYGKKAFEYFANMLKDKYNPCKVYFNSQKQVVGLYEKLGFIKDGEEFIEAGALHQKMYKNF